MKIFGQQKMSFDQVMDTCTTAPTREELFKDRQDTAAKSIWKPIPHAEFVGSVRNSLDNAGFDILESSFALNSTGRQLVGGFKVSGVSPEVEQSIDGFGQLELLLRHANDMSSAATLSAGMSIFVCTNGVITGDKLGSRKHTLNFDMDDWLKTDVMPSFVERCEGMPSHIEMMKSRIISDEEANSIILEAGRLGILPCARMLDVYKEWKTPTFSNADFEPNTAWKLYMDFTYVAQKCQPARQLQIIDQARNLIPNCMVVQ